MSLLIHHSKHNTLSDLWEHLQHLFWFESSCVISHYHRECSLQKMHHSFLVVLLSEIQWNPMSIRLIHWVLLNSFIQESLNRHVIQGSLSRFNLASSGHFGHIQQDSQTRLLLYLGLGLNVVLGHQSVGQFGVVANEVWFQEFGIFLQIDEWVQFGFLLVEGWPQR